MASDAPLELLAAIRSGDRSALARSITLVESARSEDGERASELVRLCLPLAGQSVRYGITGIPGVGKSTLIDAVGSRLVEQGHRVGVLAIDPSSVRGGGSILGDKTRMDRLAQHPHAFIRPSPTSGTLGGVGRRTRETIILCEVAGYDRLLIETVGIGQSELAVDHMTDLNLLLMLGGAGDELQGVKRGIMEVADLIALTKSDGDNEPRNQRSAGDLRSAIQFLPAREHGGRPEVVLCSAIENKGIAELVTKMEGIAAKLIASGHAEFRRRDQDRWWMRATIEERLISGFYDHPAVRAALPGLEKAVIAGTRSPFEAAEELLRAASSP
jgi:LAO/AO transport system kinase